MAKTQAVALPALESAPFFADWMKWVASEDGEYFPGDHGQHNFYFGAHPEDSRVTLTFDGASMVTLTHIQVAGTCQRKGLGTKYLTALCEVADRHQMTLNLISDESGDAAEDDSDGESDYDERDHWLQNWYLGFGFDYTGFTSDYGPWMERPPEG